ERAQSPAREELALDEHARHSRRALGKRDAGEQCLPRVRASDLTLALVTVERERIHPQALIPECRIESLAQLCGTIALSGSERLLTHHLGELRHVQPRRVDVALDLAQRDGRLGECAVAMKHRIAGVLPSLID